ncbi:hypothetical protein AU255_06220 [Methyloprofundus sedimenti]|uniref:DUF3179 domain-containing protein n=1 Tax=Methyloprofundus sedimenti TaxID=1420851 RepID=A0A1V8M7B8_9GAMM|nr:DUF3179 domain-containing (seleno)protein [Methyloprofundus sedimenti]OQK17471.1 hypothetical protein AU255_06220 [Methyloprofundus sedimenti]
MATVFLANRCFTQSKNGFNPESALLPVGHILSGGPGKNSVTAIDKPAFVSTDKAYPINILNWHEIVNDQFNGKPVVITFCPLCGSGMTFLSYINGKALTFGVPELLYNSDVLQYDRQILSLWSH